MNSPKRLARTAGVLYLLNAILSAFAYFMEKRCTSPATRPPRPGT